MGKHARVLVKELKELKELEELKGIKLEGGGL